MQAQFQRQSSAQQSFATAVSVSSAIQEALQAEGTAGEDESPQQLLTTFELYDVVSRLVPNLFKLHARTCSLPLFVGFSAVRDEHWPIPIAMRVVCPSYRASTSRDDTIELTRLFRAELGKAMDRVRREHHRKQPAGDEHDDGEGDGDSTTNEASTVLAFAESNLHLPNWLKLVVSPQPTDGSGTAVSNDSTESWTICPGPVAMKGGFIERVPNPLVYYRTDKVHSASVLYANARKDFARAVLARSVLVHEGRRRHNLNGHALVRVRRTTTGTSSSLELDFDDAREACARAIESDKLVGFPKPRIGRPEDSPAMRDLAMWKLVRAVWGKGIAFIVQEDDMVRDVRAFVAAVAANPRTHRWGTMYVKSPLIGPVSVDEWSLDLSETDGIIEWHEDSHLRASSPLPSPSEGSYSLRPSRQPLGKYAESSQETTSVSVSDDEVDLTSNNQANRRGKKTKNRKRRTKRKKRGGRRKK